MRSARTPTFRYAKATAHVERWVQEVDHPELTWAFAVVVGTVVCYADISIPDDAAPRVRSKKIAEMWEDWFNAGYDDGCAHYGIHGVYQEFLMACPSGAEGAQILVLEQAAAIGRGEVPTASMEQRRRAPTPTVMPPEPAAQSVPKLRLIDGGKAPALLDLR